MMLSVAEARYLDGHRVWLRFNTDETGVADLAGLIESNALARSLRDPVAFADFHLDEWPTLAWRCGFDVAPERLYELATGKRPDWLTPKASAIDAS